MKTRYDFEVRSSYLAYKRMQNYKRKQNLKWLCIGVFVGLAIFGFSYMVVHGSYNTCNYQDIQLQCN